MRREAARLTGMLEPPELRGGIVGFLARCTFAALTGRDAAGHLWVSPLAGEPGVFAVDSPTELSARVTLPDGDPLHALPADQPVGLVFMDFAARRRIRVNGTLTRSEGGRLRVEAEQAFGNCPKYIQQRLLSPGRPAAAGSVRTGDALDADDVALISDADTFFLGTVNRERGADASHRGGPPGFVRVDDATRLRWPDYTGNNLFNSFGNLAVNPEAALLFLDFTSGRALHLSGTAEVEWGEAGRPGDDDHTGRLVRFALQRLVTGDLAATHEVAHRPYPHNPAVTR